ncbi:MAG: hypothetical protein WC269_00295 [Candidatus Gracilibacteria bacterium]|jgi:hypothetical protein
MDLREGEIVLKVYRHHPTPFVFSVLKVILSMIPFYALVFLFGDTVSAKVLIITHIVLIAVFSFVLLYISLIYWLDKLIITNQRIVMIDYKYLTSQIDSFIMLDDIQDIKTHEKGILSYFWIFDYGGFTIETSSSTIAIVFDDAPDPEGIRRFIYHMKSQ